MTPTEFGAFAAFADLLADAAAEAIRPYFRTPMVVYDKGEAVRNDYDPVTVADRAAERAMRVLIESHYPDHGIHGEEEGTIAGRSPLHWVLDPIDGTRAFITGLPLWGTLIALNDGLRPVLGVMNQPFTGERFKGTAEASFLGNTSIKTRRCPTLTTARVMTTGPYLFTAPGEYAAFERVSAKAQLTRFGGDCYAYCMLAMGHVDVIIEASLQPYDIQALVPIIEGAGGIVTTWDGRDPQHGGRIVACGDPALHQQVLDLLDGTSPHVMGSTDIAYPPSR